MNAPEDRTATVGPHEDRHAEARTEARRPMLIRRTGIASALIAAGALGLAMLQGPDSAHAGTPAPLVVATAAPATGTATPAATAPLTLPDFAAIAAREGAIVVNIQSTGRADRQQAAADDDDDDDELVVWLFLSFKT